MRYYLNYKVGKKVAKIQTKMITNILQPWDLMKKWMPFHLQRCKGLPVVDQSVQWLIDTTASYHATPNRESSVRTEKEW